MCGTRDVTLCGDNLPAICWNMDSILSLQLGLSLGYISGAGGLMLVILVLLVVLVMLVLSYSTTLPITVSLNITKPGPISSDVPPA